MATAALSVLSLEGSRSGNSYEYQTRAHSPRAMEFILEMVEFIPLCELVERLMLSDAFVTERYRQLTSRAAEVDPANQTGQAV
jgi:hypothetical protein